MYTYLYMECIYSCIRTYIWSVYIHIRTYIWSVYIHTYIIYGVYIFMYTYLYMECIYSVYIFIHVCDVLLNGMHKYIFVQNIYMECIWSTYLYRIYIWSVYGVDICIEYIYGVYDYMLFLGDEILIFLVSLL